MQKQRMYILPASRIQSQNSFGHTWHVLAEATTKGQQTSDVCIIVTERETNTFQLTTNREQSSLLELLRREGRRAIAQRRHKLKKAA